jgi:hypothetical protein
MGITALVALMAAHRLAQGHNTPDLPLDRRDASRITEWLWDEAGSMRDAPQPVHAPQDGG